jgi:hypothetical protein
MSLSESALRRGLIGAAYGAYATPVCALWLTINATARTNSQALALGLSLWCAATLLLPRIAGQVVLTLRN